MGLSPNQSTELAMAARLAKELASDTTLQARMDLAGLGEEKLLDLLRRKLAAKETKFFADKGMVTDQRDVQAHGIQLDALKTALKMRGILTDRNGLVVHADGNVGILVGGPDAQPAAWSPQLHNSTHSNTTNDSNTVDTTVTSTIEGTGKRPGGLGHDRRNVRWQSKSVPTSKRAKALRKSNGRHGAACNLRNGQTSVPKKILKPKSKRKCSSAPVQARAKRSSKPSPRPR